MAQATSSSVIQNAIQWFSQRIPSLDAPGFGLLFSDLKRFSDRNARSQYITVESAEQHGQAKAEVLVDIEVHGVATPLAAELLVSHQDGRMGSEAKASRIELLVPVPVDLEEVYDRQESAILWNSALASWVVRAYLRDIDVKVGPRSKVLNMMHDRCVSLVHKFTEKISRPHRTSGRVVKSNLVVFGSQVLSRAMTTSGAAAGNLDLDASAEVPFEDPIRIQLEPISTGQGHVVFQLSPFANNGVAGRQGGPGPGATGATAAAVIPTTTVSMQSDRKTIEVRVQTVRPINVDLSGFDEQAMLALYETVAFINSTILVSGQDSIWFDGRSLRALSVTRTYPTYPTPDDASRVFQSMRRVVNVEALPDEDLQSLYEASSKLECADIAASVFRDWGGPRLVAWLRMRIGCVQSRNHIPFLLSAVANRVEALVEAGEGNRISRKFLINRLWEGGEAEGTDMVVALHTFQHDIEERLEHFTAPIGQERLAKLEAAIRSVERFTPEQREDQDAQRPQRGLATAAIAGTSAVDLPDVTSAQIMKRPDGTECIVEHSGWALAAPATVGGGGGGGGDEEEKEEESSSPSAPGQPGNAFSLANLEKACRTEEAFVQFVSGKGVWMGDTEVQTSVECSTEDENELGRGGFGIVYGGKLWGKACAFKYPLLEDDQAKRRLSPSQLMILSRREVIIQLHLQGSAPIAQILHVSRIDSADLDAGYRIGMEQAIRSLSDLLHRDPVKVKQHSASIIGPVTGALAAIHAKGVAHLDIKTENILVQKATASGSEDGVTAVIADFGSARPMQPSDIVRAETISSESAGPEYDGKRYMVGFPADVFALATVIYLVLAGKAWGKKLVEAYSKASEGHAVSEDDYAPPEAPGAMHPETWAVIQRMSAFKPSERITASEAFRALQDIIAKHGHY